MHVQRVSNRLTYAVCFSYHEQKSRLKLCGVRRVIYLIEDLGKSNATHTCVQATTLDQAIENTKVNRTLIT